MALFGLDAAGNSAYVQADGQGTQATPYVMQHDLLTNQMKSAFASGTASADVVAAVTNKKVRVTSLIITATAACTLQLQSTNLGTSNATNLTPAFRLPADGNLTISNELGLFETLSGEKLNAVVSSGGNYTVMVTYREV